jgi:hypothetical protein
MPETSDHDAPKRLYTMGEIRMREVATQPRPGRLRRQARLRKIGFSPGEKTKSSRFAMNSSTAVRQPP